MPANAHDLKNELTELKFPVSCCRGRLGAEFAVVTHLRRNSGRPGRRLGWLLTIAYAFAILFAAVAAYATWRNYADPLGVDFVSFWAAGKLAVSANAKAAYDIAAHRAVELTAGPLQGGLLPFPYPPPFLLVVAAFAFAPFWIAFGVWLLFNTGLYLLATRRAIPLPWSLLNPAAHYNVLIGQNGLLTASIFIVGTGQLATRPFLGGAILGLLIIKPQLACLLPVAVVAARKWRAIVGAITSSSLAIAIAAVAFGPDIYLSFMGILPRYVGFMTDGSVPWSEFASVYGFSRALGASGAVATLTQIIAACVAVVLTWRAWRREDVDRIAILAAATLLASPYLLTYDSVLLILPLAQLFARPNRSRAAALVWLFCLPPFLLDSSFYSGPNTIPIAAILSLWFLHRGNETRTLGSLQVG